MIGRRRLLMLAATLPLSACAGPDGPCPPPRVVLDVGHTPDAPGAISASGITELLFNRRFAARLADALRGGLRSGTVAVLEIGEPDPRLDRRVAAIAAARPSLVLSVHHDSVQERYLTRRIVDGAERHQTDTIAGFSLFVPTAGLQATASLDTARTIAEALLAAGERPSLHHAEPIEGEDRRLLDAAYGIYAGDFLKILRSASAPTVLIEVGVIKNPAEERRLSDPATIAVLADAVAGAAVAASCRVNGRRAARTAGSPRTRSPTG